MSLGQMPTASERRPIRGGRVRAGLMERSLDQCSEGNAINARRSSSACSSTWQTFGAIEVRRARTSVTVAGLGAVDLAEPASPTLALDTR